MARRDHPHLGCIADARGEAEAARERLLAFDAVWGASLTSPREDPFDAWTIELSLVTGPETDAEGVEPHHQDAARCYGLTIRRLQDRSPHEKRVLLTV
jgi:hypothetical protein